MSKEQVFTQNGEPLIGLSVERDEFRDRLDYLMGTAHIWVWRYGASGVEMMLQKRSMAKKTHPGMLSTSAAGHIDVGETAIEAAVREAKEEIGLEIDPQKLLFVASLNRNIQGNGQNISTMYLYEVGDTYAPVLQKSEVESYEWVSREDFRAMVTDPTARNLIDHGQAYNEALFMWFDKV
ncbi:MAG TPA: NUDIX domain-containing protein [Candidatus Saccharimonadaceae bacterium]|nr:NUDIX domain-containing protein [Candidatus Saccharimonadaceae bacterium]